MTSRPRQEVWSLQEHEVHDLFPITSAEGEGDNRLALCLKASTVNRFKARLVVQVYVQAPVIDYRNSFAPVCHFRRQSILLAIAFEHGWPTYLLCVKAAFLQMKKDSELFAKQAPGQVATDHNPDVPLTMNLRLRRFGLGSSTVLWCDTIDAALLGIKFTPTLSDLRVYIHGRGNTFAILIMYVDGTLERGCSEAAKERL